MPCADIQIRAAKKEDAAQIALLLSESFAEYKPLYTDEGLSATTPTSEQVQRRLREGAAWVVSQGDQLIGTISTVAHGEALYIRGMAVLPAARGAGAGTLLLEQVERFARYHGFKRLFLSTTPFLSPAIRLYESFGYQRVEDGPHDLFGTPLFTMEKLLLAREDSCDGV
jgi:putative acetyltransferase